VKKFSDLDAKLVEEEKLCSILNLNKVKLIKALRLKVILGENE